MTATKAPPPDGRSAFFAGSTSAAGLRFGAVEHSRRGALASRARRTVSPLRDVSDAELQAALTTAGQRAVAARYGVARRTLHAELVKRFGAGNGTKTRAAHPLPNTQVRPRGAGGMFATSARPRRVQPRQVAAVTPHSPPQSRPYLSETRSTATGFAGWSGDDWPNWMASAPIEEQQAFNAYGMAILNRKDGDPPVPIPTLSDPVPHSHDRGPNNVDIKRRKARPAQPIKAVTVGEKWR